MPRHYTAENLRLVILLPWSRALGPALASRKVKGEIVRCKAESCRDTVYHDSDPVPVGLPEDRNPEIFSESIHNALNP